LEIEEIKNVSKNWNCSLVFQFLEFLEWRKASADDDAVVWDRGTLIPYPTNDASASSEAKHIYKTFRRAAKIGIFSFLLRFTNIGISILSSFYEKISSVIGEQ